MFITFVVTPEGLVKVDLTSDLKQSELVSRHVIRVPVL